MDFLKIIVILQKSCCNLHSNNSNASDITYFSFFLIKKKQKIKGNDAAPLPGPSDS
jgi:hypothetical protein